PAYARVINTNEMYLGGTLFRLSRPVQKTLVPNVAAKVTIGDSTRDSYIDASVLALTDWRRGIGLYQMEGASESDRVWWSTCNLNQQRHMILPPLITQTEDVGGLNIILGELGGFIYATFGNSIHKYNNTTDSWGTAVGTLPANATHSITVRL